MEENDSIDLRKYIKAIRKHWLWYVIALILFMSLGITYHFARMDQFMAHSGILIEDDEGTSGGVPKMAGGMAAVMRTFSIGGLGSSSVDNELLIFQSHNVLMKAVKQLGVNRTYIERDGLKKINLYDKSPILVTCADSLLDTISKGIKMKVDIKADGKVNIKATKGLIPTTLARIENATLPTVVKTDYGTFHVLKTKHFVEGEDRNITVFIANTEGVVQDLTKLLEIDYASKKGDGVYLGFKTTNKQYGKDMLNGIMNIYNDIRIERKNSRASHSLKFYDEQIEILSKQLNDAEMRFQEFQTKNDIISPSQEAMYLYSADKESEKVLLELQNEMTAYNLIMSIVTDPNRKYDLLPPSGAGIASVAQYNELILKKQELETTANADNIVLKNLIMQIDAMRELVAENIALVKENTSNAINSIKGLSGKNKSKLNQVPSYQREFIALNRDKEIMNELYMFLLEKRYNSAMTLSSNFPRGFVIDPAYTDLKPLKTKSLIALGACFAMALILPTIAVCIKVNRKPEDDEETIEVED